MFSRKKKEEIEPEKPAPLVTIEYLPIVNKCE